MSKIRLCSSVQVLGSEGATFGAQDWVDCTPERLHHFRLLVRAGEEVDGVGSHWIEKRASEGACVVRLLDVDATPIGQVPRLAEVAC